jgi:hypothetical protein
MRDKSGFPGWHRIETAVLVVTVSLSGCAARPSAAVLEPHSVQSESTDNVTVLAVKNRERGKGAVVFVTSGRAT